MPAKPVLKMGNTELFEKSITVNALDDPIITKIINEMKLAMNEYGGVGIAAPQIGYKKRIIMFGFDHNERYPDEKPIPFTILINPLITAHSANQADDWEGCLSVPGLRGLVPRYTEIDYQGVDPHGKLIKRTVNNFHARLIQHECDHLDGILFPQRITDMKNFGFENELKSRNN